MTRMNSQNAATARQHELFARTLDELEVAVATPIVPGEIDRWCVETVGPLKVTAKLFVQEMRPDHAAILETIEREDPELMVRVQDLRECDRKLNQRVAEIEVAFERLSKAADAMGADEAVMADDVTKFVSAVQQLVIDLRQQETALGTWLQEAVNRDRGDGD